MPRSGTPPGVPTSDNGSRSDSGLLSARLLVAVNGVGAAADDDPGALGADPDAFLDALADKLAEKQHARVANGGGGGGHRKFLGLAGGDWTKLLIGWTVVILVFMGTWYMSVRDGLAARPTTSQVESRIGRSIDDVLGRHELNRSHPNSQKQINAIKKEQRLIRDSQIRQEVFAETQTDVLKDIKSDLKKLRRNR